MMSPIAMITVGSVCGGALVVAVNRFASMPWREAMRIMWFGGFVGLLAAAVVWS